MTATSNPTRVDRSGAVTFHHPAAFWFGVVAVSAGVLLYLPMYLMGRHSGYRLAGMPIDDGMLYGMAAIMIDIMKSTAMAFVVAGMKQEYKLKSPLNPGGARTRRHSWRWLASAAPCCESGWATGSAGTRRSCTQASTLSPRRSTARCLTSSGTSAYAF